MGQKVKITFNNKTEKSVNKAFQKAWFRSQVDYFKLLNKDGEKIIIDNAISKGISPVKGERRFKGYKSSYKEQILDRWASRYGKRLRPVNLNLTGKMMKSFRIIAQKKGIVLQFTDIKVKTHNEGDKKRGIPARPFLPTKPGQQFSRRVITEFNKLLTKVVKKNF